MSIKHIAPKRRLLQLILLFGLFVVPFLSVNGNPFFKLDIGLRTFFMVGVPVRIDQFYLVLLLTLSVAAGFLLLTVLLGRVWCGWFCPQTILNDLAEFCSEKFLRVLSPAVSKWCWHITVIFLAMIFSVFMLCLFQSPCEVTSNIWNFESHPVIFSSFVITSILIYLDIVLVRRSFCRSYCPYGRFQTALMDEGTLNLAFLEETRDRCLLCSSCVRVCPMGIDIRAGFQIECINCGRCIDACRNVMDKRGSNTGLIAYCFGSHSGNRIRIGTKSAVLIFLSIVVFCATGWGISHRSDTAFSVQRDAAAEPREMPDGSLVQVWRAVIGNRSTTEEIYSIELSSQRPGLQAELLGPVTAIRISPNENRQVGFSIRYSTKPVSGQIMTVRLKRSGRYVIDVTVQP
jgi:polyferredoxin